LSVQGGALLRHCQKCSVLHPVTAFEGAKRSCRAQLERQRARRAARIGGAGATAANLARETGVRLATSAADLLAGADAVVVACKPQVFLKLDPSFGPPAAGKLVLRKRGPAGADASAFRVIKVLEMQA
jgi:hypothetical protein